MNSSKKLGATKTYLHREDLKIITKKKYKTKYYKNNLGFQQLVGGEN